MLLNNRPSIRLPAAVWVALLLTAATWHAPGRPGTAAELSTKYQSLVKQQVIPAYRSDDPVRVLRAVSPLVERLTDEQLTDVDALLAVNKVPPLRQLLAESRLVLMRTGQRGVPAARGRALLLTAETLRDTFQEMLGDAKSHPAMAEPLPTPKDLQEYEDLFWKIHVLTNQLVNGRQMAEYAHSLTTSRGVRKEDRDGLPDFAAQVKAIDGFGADLGERRVELHIQRLESAIPVLSESADVKQRIFAAYSVDFDGQVLEAFLEEHKKKGADAAKYGRERLNSANFEQEIKQLITTARSSAGDLTAKSRLFFDGLHWWMRGRYGRGAEQGGLMKSRYALQSSQAQLALAMPTQAPKPIDPLQGDGYQTPEVDRRHHYIWATEQPRFQTTTTYFH